MGLDMVKIQLGQCLYNHIIINEPDRHVVHLMHTFFKVCPILLPVAPLGREMSWAVGSETIYPIRVTFINPPILMLFTLALREKILISLLFPELL